VYEIVIESRAEKELEQLPKNILRKLDIKFLQLKKNPRDFGSKKLTGRIEGWRIRIQDYRVLYQIDDKQKLVKIFRIKHRRDVYR
jgi:mRNA interferase RelE/StbE